MATIKDISSLKIKGANFIDETVFNLFNKNTVTVIYGENGAGKSTIARGIYKCANHANDREIRVVFQNLEGDEIEIDEASQHIFVFDEDYIQNKVGMKSTDGLDTIVILGSLKDVEEKISEKKSLLDKESLVCQEEKEKLKKLEDPKNKESYLFTQNRIYEKLRKDGGWAERLSKIRNKKTKAKVKDTVINTINSHHEFIQNMPADIKNKPQQKQVWINTWIHKQIEYFNKELKLYQDTSQNTSPISEQLRLEFNQFDEAVFVKTLAKAVEKPKITERDELILSIVTTIQEKGVGFIEDVKREFEREDVNRCPYCQQEVDSRRKKVLLEALGKVLDAQAKNDVSTQLSKYRISELQRIEWEKFEPLNKPEVVENCKNAIEALNGRIHFINEKLDKKINNPYQSIVIRLEDVGINAAYESAMKYVQILNGAVEDYNKAINEHQRLGDNLVDLNNNIAFWEIYKLNEEMKDAMTKYNEQENIVSKLDKELTSMKKEVSVLEEKKRQVKIAVDEINASLAYIFLSTDRLKIEYDESNNVYKIKVKQMDVKPENVSVGERNAIALSYFFSEIKKDKEEENFYSGEYLLVIDDPISSFDRENRIGVISFLRHELLRFDKGNQNTKFIILTHDMQVLLDLQKMLESLSEEPKAQKRKKIFCILENKQLRKLDIKRYQEYSFLMQKIYLFAKGQDCENFNVEIGNMLRRIMEAYSTFLYKTSGANLFNNDIVLNKIENLSRREFFRNCMIRLFLNTDSHYEEAVKSFNDMNFFNTLPTEKKQEYAKYVLCFLYILNPAHILAHLGNKGSSTEWSEECLKNQFIEWIKQLDAIANASTKNNVD